MDVIYWLGKELTDQKYEDFKKEADHTRQVKAATQGHNPWFITINPFSGHGKKVEIENSPETKEPVHSGGLSGN